ncbi:aldo-keto reductase family 1 member C23-like protein [Pomacea canaliculata]|uniref:aldo-keto reductase family 1 member C23-like protein n=1 Tax=Pomacea canaliculata TaxID=400727 RepID=UPI000D731379|nr:aldo-keto reductase family 1 member C23-like protein [Pomacea canaliculata]
MEDGLFTLSNGRKAPAIAFGTWQVSGNKIREMLPLALDAGYRHIDTAYSYDNEDAIGEVLESYFSQGKLKREDIFLATKLWVTFLGKDDVRRAVDESLRRLMVDYVDLLMIHAPWGFKNRGDGTLFPQDEHGNFELENYDLRDTWRELERLVVAGKVKSLGLSNFNSVQVDLICHMAHVPPVCNQVECHAYLPQVELQEFCQKLGVLLSAFAPLGSPGRSEHLVTEGEPVLLQEPILEKIGSKYNKTPAQVLIRSLLQRGILVSVKSITPKRIEENIEVFDFALTVEDMQEIAKLRNDHRFFPFRQMAGDHPQYPFSIPY